MGKNTKNTTSSSYETVVQLLVLAVAILAPYFAFNNLMDLELFSVSKTMLITLWSSINPWLCPPYVYLLINFIIFIIFASSFINYNTIFFNPSNDHNQSFIESSLVPQNLEVGSLSDDDQLIKFHTLEDTFKVCEDDDDIKSPKLENTISECHNNSDDTFKDWNDYDVGRRLKPESVVDHKRPELRKSKTFHEGGSRPRGRTERYVRILSQDELDRQVEAFIRKFKKEVNLQKSESNKGLEFGSVY